MFQAFGFELDVGGKGVGSLGEAATGVMRAPDCVRAGWPNLLEQMPFPHVRCYPLDMRYIYRSKRGCPPLRDFAHAGYSK